MRPCEPRLLYTVDAAGIPQVSQEAVDIVNAIAAGLINPENLGPGMELPSNIETKPNELKKLFELSAPPPGFEDLALPVLGV